MPSTAWTVPTCRLKTAPFVSGKCLTRPSTLEHRPALLARPVARRRGCGHRRRERRRWRSGAAASISCAADGRRPGAPASPSTGAQLGLDSSADVARASGSAARTGSPGGRLDQRRRVALDRRQRLRRPPVEPRDRAAAGPACTASAGGRRRRRRCPVSTSLPAYMTATRSAKPATTPRSWVISTIAAPVISLGRLQHLEDLRLDGDVERGGRLVGDDQRRGRWRWPSRSSRAAACRRRTRAGRPSPAAPALGMPTSVEQLDGALARGRRLADVRRGRRMRLGDLVADRVDGRERGQRVLEDHRDLLAADGGELPVVRAEQLARRGTGPSR